MTRKEKLSRAIDNFNEASREFSRARLTRHRLRVHLESSILEFNREDEGIILAQEHMNKALDQILAVLNEEET